MYSVKISKGGAYREYPFTCELYKDDEQVSYQMKRKCNQSK